MGKIEVSIALEKLDGAFKYTFKGKTATKECVCIPVETLKSGAWLNLDGNDDTKYERQTHSLKQHISTERYKEYRAKGEYPPYVGSVRTPRFGDGAQPSGQAPTGEEPTGAYNGEDLPF